MRWAPGFPCALLFWRDSFLGTIRARRVAGMRSRVSSTSARHPTAVMPRFRRGIQYSRESDVKSRGPGLLGRPVKPGDDERRSGARVRSCVWSASASSPGRHRPRRRANQYSRGSEVKSRGHGLLGRPVPSTPRLRRACGLRRAEALAKAASRAMTSGEAARGECKSCAHVNSASARPSPSNSMVTRSPALSQIVLTRLPVSTIWPACKPLPSAAR